MKTIEKLRILVDIMLIKYYGNYNGIIASKFTTIAPVPL